MDTNTEKKGLTIPWKKILLLSGLSFLLLLALVLGIVWYLISSAPDIDSITVSPLESATYICDENGNELRKLTLAASNRDIVSLDQIPVHLQHAVVAIEDERFYDHGGIDLRGIARAFLTGISSGSFSEGASTITQQLIKNSVFTEWTLENSFADRLSRKVQEQYLAILLEDRMGKDEILEHYLNTINLGAGCYGVQSASRRYFGKNVSELNLSEAAVLAAIPQNPTGYNPIHHPQANRKRAQTVLQYMENQGYITAEEHLTALEDTVYTRIREYDDAYEENSVYTYYEDALITQALDLLEQELGLSSEQSYRAVYSGGLRIFSAQDAALQQICDEEFANPDNFPDATLTPQPQASLVLMDQHTGFVRAIVGGRGEKTASLTLNRATETTRQPGSTFKILTAYAPALDAFHQTLATEYSNEPYRYENGTTVSNWDVNDYSGTVTIRDAIIRSINVVAVRCITEITPRTGFDYAQKFGISTLHESYESGGTVSTDIIQPLALGGITQGVTNLELCSAYSAIANNGFANRPLFITKIFDRSGNLLLDFTQQHPTPVIKASTSFLLTSAMEDVVGTPSGTAYGTISAAGHPVAGKTGTTSNYKDIWFVGYTPWYTCSVWGGYDNNENLPDGARAYSKTLWSAVMNRIHSTLPIRDFVQPESVISVSLCKKSHRLAVPDGCPETYTEYFEKGTEPNDTCSLHEPLPETEPIIIYTELLEELLTETESESETPSITESETAAETLPETFPDIEILPDDDLHPDTEAESLSESESDSGSETEKEPSSDEKPVPPSTSSLEDLIQRLHLP